MVSIFDAEVVEGGYPRCIVPAGTEVAIGDGWIVTVTRQGLNCDCGKGVLCPSNPMRRGVQ